MRWRTAAEMLVLLLLICRLGVSHSTLSDSSIELDLEKLEEIMLRFKTDEGYTALNDDEDLSGEY